MGRGRDVVSELWPEHTEILADEDWSRLQAAAESYGDGDQPPILQPIGEAKDELIRSLMIVYWGLKVIHVAIQVWKEVESFPPESRTAEVKNIVLVRLGAAIPRQVRDRIDPLIRQAT